MRPTMRPAMRPTVRPSMRRTLCLAGAVLAAGGLSLFALKARSDTQVRSKAAYRLMVSRFPKARALAPAAAAARASNNAFILDNGDILFLDRDNDGNLTFGDELIVHGPLVNYQSGRDVGTWEGTLTVTNDLTYLAHLTLLFPGSGTLTISGAPYQDGARGNYFLAPIVGVTGFVRARGSAAFFNDTAGNLVVALGVR